MSQALHLMNAPEIAIKLSSDRGRAARLSNCGKTTHEILDEFALAAWGRLPNDRERKRPRESFRKATSGRRPRISSGRSSIRMTSCLFGRCL